MTIILQRVTQRYFFPSMALRVWPTSEITRICMISIEATTKLLKLHLRWPERKRHAGKEDQAMAFYTWLFLNHHDRAEVIALDDVEFVQVFLDKNTHVLWPTKKDEEKWANLRLEPRIENDVKVELTVTQCDDPTMVGIKIQGRTLDIGLHGMRIIVTENIPENTLLKLIVSKDEEKARSYQLNAKLRWGISLANGYLIGVKIDEDNEFNDWKSNFGAEFVAPVLGKS